MDRINSVLAAGSNSVLQAGSPAFSATVTDTLKNDIVSKLRQQYLEYANREADWSTRYGNDHLAVVNLRNQMREIRNSIFEELKRLGETYKSDYEIAKQREVSIQQDLAQAVSQSQVTDAKSVTLRELQSTAQTYKTIYENFLQRYMEAVQQQSFPITEARPISLASRPLGKSHPRTLVDLVLACLGGIALGIGIGALRDMSDRVFRSGDQVESLLQTECIALVPKVTDDAQINKSDDPKARSNQNELKVSGQDDNETRTIAKSLMSASSEALRSLAVVSDLQGTIKSTKNKINSLTSSVSSLDNSSESAELIGIFQLKNNCAWRERGLDDS